MRFFLILLLTFFYLSACQSAKDALTLKKKESGDEFLVEKKNPLVLPPDYGKLPEPSENKLEQKKEEENEIKVSLSKDKFEPNETIMNSEPTSIEESI